MAGTGRETGQRRGRRSLALALAASLSVHLLVLLALALWPRRVPAPPAREPLEFTLLERAAPNPAAPATSAPSGPRRPGLRTRAPGPPGETGAGAGHPAPSTPDAPLAGAPAGAPSLGEMSARAAAAVVQRRGPERPAGEPAPGRGFADRDEQADQPQGEQHRARPVDVPRRPDGRLGDDEHRREHGQPDRDERDPEQPVVIELREDRPGENDPEAASHAEEPGDERDPRGDALARELVANDSERQREDRAAEALNRTGADHHGKCRRDSRDERPRAQAGEHDHQRPLLAEHVTDTPGNRRRHRRRQQVRREDPRHTRRRRVEIALQRRKRRHDERLQHRVRRTPERENGEETARVGRGSYGSLHGTDDSTRRSAPEPQSHRFPLNQRMSRASKESRTPRRRRAVLTPTKRTNGVALRCPPASSRRAR